MSIYHLPTNLGGTEILPEIEHLAALLGDANTRIGMVVEVCTDHPAIIAVINHLSIPPAPVDPESPPKKPRRPRQVAEPAQATRVIPDSQGGLPA